MQETKPTLTALKSQLAFIGALLKSYPRITEVMCNEDGAIWIDNGGSLQKSGVFLSAEQRTSAIDLLAGLNGLACNENNPSLSVKLPIFGGGRFQALKPPVVQVPIFSLRIPAKTKLSLDELAAGGMLRLSEALFLRQCLAAKKNIIVAGGTGSGKTTLAGALANLIQGERVLVIEDNPELSIDNANTAYLQTNARYSLSSAVFDSLRLRPDRIIVGEIRDGQTAMGLLEAWLTGHPGGIATIHANSADEVEKRLRELLGRVTANVPADLLKTTLDVIVFAAKISRPDGSTGRKVLQIKQNFKLNKEF